MWNCKSFYQVAWFIQLSEAGVSSVSLKIDNTEYRAVIKFFVKEGSTPNEIHSKFFIVRPRTFLTTLVNETARTWRPNKLLKKASVVYLYPHLKYPFPLLKVCTQYTRRFSTFMSVPAKSRLRSIVTSYFSLQCKISWYTKPLQLLNVAYRAG